MRNALDLYSQTADESARAGQEAIDPTPSASNAGTGKPCWIKRALSAGGMTFIFAIFFFGLAYALGNLTGEALFRKVEEVV